MDLFNLKAKLTLDKTEYEKGIDEAKKENDGFTQAVSKQLLPVTLNAWVEIGKKVLEVAQKIGQLVMQTMQYADQIGELAAKYNVTTESIAEMQYMATQTGTEVSRLLSSMAMMYNRAKEGDEAFSRLGVSINDTNGNIKNMDVLFWESIEALNGIENEGQKSAMMLDVFGRAAMENGEFLRKTTEELNAMRQEAHDLGIVLNEETTDFAGGFFDKIDQLKLQGQSALASLVAGAPDAEEKFQNFIDNIFVMLDKYAPAFLNFGLRLLLQLAVSLIRVSPSLAWQWIEVILDVILDFQMWFQVGIDIAKAIVEGLLNVIPSALNALFGWAGVDIPKIDFGVGENLFVPNVGSEYEISERIEETVTVKVEASGDTAVSKDTAEKTAQALAPYLDKLLGGV